MEIIHCDDRHLRALLEDRQGLERRLKAAIPEGLIELEFAEAFRYSLNELLRRPDLFGFWTALFVLENPRTICGIGGFKGPPGADGAVEIGYSIAPGFRGRGLATEAARELVRLAFADPRVLVVVAHTLAVWNASTRVLEKNGFGFVRELVDPKEHPDPIWRWELQRR
ncbi:MAG: GNAT family N-acetyltransferase [Deltaproteobacteria bacterium]|nr:MAG: GNAT family N-acetyltransferase [Deltaproteobacteria bacterium]